jgi:hypothetical protein
VINEDIDAIIARGEERTMKLNSKYEGLNLEDLNNFKSDASVQQWEGEDFRTGVRFLVSSSVFGGDTHWANGVQKKTLNFNLLSLSKRERKSNYSVDNYFKDTLRAGPSKVEKAPKIPRAPKQIAMYVLFLLSVFWADADSWLFPVKTSSSSLRNLRCCRSESLRCIRYVIGQRCLRCCTRC